ncbi:MAG: histidine phosphatase family protein [Acutalibacteraceae bacterium]|nr:histidine phosphatase family protein [Acutalibacteraceae bacterium]
MTEIYMVRHCEAMGNVMRLFQGSSDFDISETGEKQLEYLKNRFKDIKLDKVYTSPLIRARKTALAVIGDRSLEPIDEKGLIELDGGIVEGKPFKETFNSIPGLADAWDNHPEDFAPEGGEKMRDAYERIWNTVKKIAAENKGKAVACTTHGGVTRCLLCRLLKGDITKLKEMPWSENTAVTLIRFDDSLNPEVVFYNDTAHLPEELIPKRSRLSSFMGKASDRGEEK